MRKVLKWSVIISVSFVAVIVIAAIIAVHAINKDMIAKQMENTLNRKVTIGAVKVSIFSVVSGIDVEDVRISNFVKEDIRKTMKDVPDSNLFVSLKAFRFKLRFGALLKKRFEITEITLYEPYVSIVRYANGALNISDLLLAPPKKKEETDTKPGPTGLSKPLSADDIPLAVSIGKIGLENGTVDITDVKLGQKVSLYAVRFLIHTIAINPKNLENENQIRISFSAGIKTVGTMKTESVKSFDITFASDGFVKPFDSTTRLLNPEVNLTVGSPKGMVTGLQVFNSIKSVQALEKYCGKLEFLKDTLEWKDANVEIWYKENTVALKKGVIKTDDGNMTFDGSVNTVTQTVNATAGIQLAEKHNQSIRNGVMLQAEKAVKTANIEKYIKADSLTDSAMKYVTNEKGQIDLQFEIKGSLSRPATTLISPKLPTMNDLVKDATKSIQNAVKDEVKKEADKQIDKVKDDAVNKLKGLIK